MPSTGGNSLEKAKQAIRELDYNELRELRSHLDGLLEEKKQHEIERLRQEAQALGIDLRAIARAPAQASTRKASSTGGKAKVWYRHPDNPELVWRGKGKRPRWLQEMLDRGDDISGLQIEPEE